MNIQHSGTSLGVVDSDQNKDQKSHCPAIDCAQATRRVLGEEKNAMDWGEIRDGFQGEVRLGLGPERWKTLRQIEQSIPE